MTETILEGKRAAMMFAVMFVATLMDGLDSSIVSVALPDIAEGLGVDTGTSAWVSIIYMMMLAGLIVPFARVCSNTGVRTTLVSGFAIFTVSSLFCGIFDSFPLLIASRGLQGIGAAMLAAAGPICCTEHMSRDRLAFGMAVLTIGGSIGYALGPALGGVIVQFVSWHWVFLINIPIGLAVIPIACMAIPSVPKREKKASMDIAGAATLFVSLSSGIFAIETFAYPDMRTFTVIAAALFALFTPMFVICELRHPDPMLKLRMFRDFGFTSVFLCLMSVNIAYMTVIYLGPFYAEICVGLSPLEVGLLLFIPALITSLTGMTVSRMSDRWGRRPFCIVAGLVTGITMLSYILLADTMDIFTFGLIMIPQGLGWAFVGGPMASRLVEHAGEERDMAASMTNEAYYVGGSLGLAISAMVFTLFSHSEGVDITDVPASSFSEGFVAACAVALAFAAAIAVLSFVLRDDKI